MRLIDADGLSENIHDNVSTPYEEAVAAKEDCLREIEEAPTIDAVPVRYGRWGVDGVYVVCSVCNKFTLSPIVKQLPTFKYCPNCGAKMNGGDADD